MDHSFYEWIVWEEKQSSRFNYSCEIYHAIHIQYIQSFSQSFPAITKFFKPLYIS